VSNFTSWSRKWPCSWGPVLNDVEKKYTYRCYQYCLVCVGTWGRVSPKWSRKVNFEGQSLFVFVLTSKSAKQIFLSVTCFQTTFDLSTPFSCGRKAITHSLACTSKNVSPISQSSKGLGLVHIWRDNKLQWTS
jgi:hypothetical protein